jgi:hypothetical protein
MKFVKIVERKKESRHTKIFCGMEERMETEKGEADARATCLRKTHMKSQLI